MVEIYPYDTFFFVFLNAPIRELGTVTLKSTNPANANDIPILLAISP
jgi:hypothetical protein